GRGRRGGDRAAAGLSIAEENVEAFADAFAEQAAAVLAEEDLEQLTSIDAIVTRGADLSLDLCAELARLAPFGLGNPAPTLLAPGCGLAELATVGDGKHLRFRIRREGRDGGSAIAFGQGSRLDVLRPEALYDVAFRLEENHWNGTVAPQLVVRRIFTAAPRYRELHAWLTAEWKKAEDGGAVVGHVIVSRGHVEPSGEPIFLLGPIGVVPEREGEGIGSSLVDAALAGDPAYYERFGFLEAEPLELLPPAGWRSRPFQVALLDPEAELPQGRVEYSNAFRD